MSNSGDNNPEVRTSAPALNDPTPVTTFASNSPRKQVPVAVYKAPQSELARILTRTTLIYIAPVFFVVVIALVVYITIISNTPETLPTTTAESVTMTDIPLPIGVREINKNPDPTFGQLSANFVNTAIPNFLATTQATEIYAAKNTPDTFNNFYNDKLIKTGLWKQYNKSKIEYPYEYTPYYPGQPLSTPLPPNTTPDLKNARTYVFYYYTRATKDPRVFDVIFFRYEEMKSEAQATQRGQMLGRKIEFGDTILYLSKLIVRQRG
jgi:hypothetical protein